MAIYCFVYNYLMMTFLKTHYFIDLIGGFAMGYIAGRLGEKYSYIIDVKLFGILSLCCRRFCVKRACPCFSCDN